jgi:hypothetical protein
MAPGWRPAKPWPGPRPASSRRRDGSFITGSDLLIDGGVIAAIAAGRFKVQMG